MSLDSYDGRLPLESDRELEQYLGWRIHFPKPSDYPLSPQRISELIVGFTFDQYKALQLVTHEGSKFCRHHLARWGYHASFPGSPPDQTVPLYRLEKPAETVEPAKPSTRSHRRELDF